MNDGAPFPGLEGVIKPSKVIQGPPKAQDLLSGCVLGIRKKSRLVKLETQNYIPRKRTERISRQCNWQHSAWKMMDGTPMGETRERTCLRSL